MPQVPIRSLLKVLTITLIMHVCSTGMRFTATLDAINSGASTFWVGAMLASISLGPMCFAIPSGRWLDRGGPRGPLAGARIGMMLAGSSVLLFPAAQYGIASLFAAATLTGFSFMLTNVVVQRLTGDVSTPKTRQLAFTALSLTTATSNLASPVAAGYLIEHFSYAAVYMWALGLPLLLSIVLLFPGMRRLLNTASRRRKKFLEADGQTNKERSGSAMDFLKDPPMRAVLCASVMISIAWEVGNLLIPVYADSVGLSPSEIGWVLGSFACATFVVRFCTPILLRYVLEWHMIVLSLFLATLAFAVMPFTHNPYALMAAAFLEGLGLGASLPNMMSLVYLFAPPHRIGEAIGLRITALNAGKSILPLFAGFLGTLIGAGGSIWVLAACTAGGFAYAACAASEVLKRMRALRIDGEYAKKPVAGDPHDHQELHH
ncbi:MFS transporter [Sutterella wadsworthensis]|uniref:MFS transporter n=2 Tax=Sutterella wadsworthensis TaxID=40545 RepID=UPI00265CD52C|nr:MFS transporter [Sutterella wadsworthensis]